MMSMMGIIISLIILLIGVGYYIYTIMSLAFKELEMGAMTPPSRKRYNFRVIEINRVLDGDTIDVIDLGFDLLKKLELLVWTPKKEPET